MAGLEGAGWEGAGWEDAGWEDAGWEGAGLEHSGLLSTSTIAGDAPRKNIFSNCFLALSFSLDSCSLVKQAFFALGVVSLVKASLCSMILLCPAGSTLPEASLAGTFRLGILVGWEAAKDRSQWLQQKKGT